tara:strand:+ start:701 stop:2179 length:1479 start_codon:yes stop_codon:yes gene_type:complete
MPTQVQWRRGTTTQHNSFTGAAGEVTVDTTLDTLRVHDGSTAGGIRIAKFSEITSGDITAVVAGTGLSGGATSGSATLNLSHLGLESLSDPNDDQIVFWDDSAGATAFLDIGSGLAISGTTLSSSITQYADSDARGSISVTDSGGDGSLAYNSSTGVITYTGPSAAEVRAHLSAGTGVTYSGGAISIGQAVATSSNVTFADVAATGNVTITGNLDVNGTTTTLDSTNSTITDRLIELGNGTTGTPANDMGIVLERGSSDNAFMGWDESADSFILGTGSFTGASTGNLTITAADLVVAELSTSNVDITGNITVSGTVDGRDLATDGSKLDGIESGATADQTDEEIQDIVGAMFSSNTETGITATYQDADGTIDLVVGTLNQNTTGSAAKWTTARTLSFTGDVTGSGSVDGSANVATALTIASDAVEQSMIADDAVGSDQIANNAVALGTQTTGNYMAQVSGGDGITISHTQGEGSTATITGTAIYNAAGTKLN